jgi:hypothetical protein
MHVVKRTSIHASYTVFEATTTIAFFLAIFTYLDRMATAYMVLAVETGRLYHYRT